jgi:uncharacterized membrane protein YdjX (TVP38/TMEM64 family)
MVKLDKKTVVKFSLILLVFAGIMGGMYAFGWLDLFFSRERLLQFIADHRPYAVIIFIGLQALQVVFAPVPGEVTGFVGGFLFDPFWGVVYSTIGLTIGSVLAFVLARIVGRPLVESIVSPEIIQRYDYVMKHKGLFLALLLFVIPGFPKDYLCYMLGLGHMKFGAFLLISTAGRLLGTVMLTLGGAFFCNRQYWQLFTLAGICIFFILITMIYRNAIERWFRNLRAGHLIRSRIKREQLKEKS